MVHEDIQKSSQTEVHNKINNVTSSVLPAIRQPPGECDPESDQPCSCPRRRFADPLNQWPVPATYQHWWDGLFQGTTGKPMKIHTKPDAVPNCCKKTTVVLLNFPAQVKADILENCDEGDPGEGASWRAGEDGDPGEEEREG